MERKLIIEFSNKFWTDRAKIKIQNCNKKESVKMRKEEYDMVI
jgi:hypothetical protein